MWQRDVAFYIKAMPFSLLLTSSWFFASGISTMPGLLPTIFPPRDETRRICYRYMVAQFFIGILLLFCVLFIGLGLRFMLAKYEASPQCVFNGTEDEHWEIPNDCRDERFVHQ